MKCQQSSKRGSNQEATSSPASNGKPACYDVISTPLLWLALLTRMLVANGAANNEAISTEESTDAGIEPSLCARLL